MKKKLVLVVFLMMIGTVTADARTLAECKNDCYANNKGDLSGLTGCLKWCTDNCTGNSCNSSVAVKNIFDVKVIQGAEVFVCGEMANILNQSKVSKDRQTSITQ